MLRLALWLFSAKLVFCSCRPEQRESGFKTQTYTIRQTGRLPQVVNESSGLAWAKDSTLWTHNDGNNGSFLYRVSQKGKLLQILHLPTIHNLDWEDLAQDTLGNLYIGDFGNNFNDKTTLKVYKLNPHYPQRIDSLCFRYADQTEFPPPPGQLNFDCEAFFWFRGNLYLFSKNRGEMQVKYYVLPDQPGSYILPPSPKTAFLQTQITAADISPDGKMFALLGYGKTYLFRLTDSTNLFAEPFVCLKLVRGQTEGLVFKNNRTLVISNEQGKLFEVKWK
jgi:hypothetical protein